MKDLNKRLVEVETILKKLDENYINKIPTEIWDFIEKNKDIERERKPALQYQNLICGVAGATLANGVNNNIQKHQVKIIEELI